MKDYVHLLTPDDLAFIGDYIAGSPFDIVAPEDYVKEPEFLLRIGDAGVFSRGNFSALIGKQKSRKTSLMKIFASAILGRNYGLIFNPKEPYKLLYFDTEQGLPHVHRIAKYLDQTEGDFAVYSLRKYSPDVRRRKIMAEIYSSAPDMIIIDGVRDLVFDINDQHEATVVVTDLMRWTLETNSHLLAVIHVNKSDMNARGHIGTELQNKCENVFSIKENIDTKWVSDVENEFSRNKPAPDFGIEINDKGDLELHKDGDGNIIDF